LAAALNEIETYREFRLSELASISSQSITPKEKMTIETLLKLKLVAAARSYEQAMTDLADNRRTSFRGTAVELRETLRDVLDHLAPDKDVMKTPGFKLEKDQDKPTMRQKVLFILRSRGQTRDITKTPEQTVILVEELTASLVRSVYVRGSISTHLGAPKPEVQKLKQYIDVLLSELLELQ
jgi:hypothetical protein